MKRGLPTPRWQRALLWAAAATVLAAVFAAYLSPHMAVDLAARVWSCF
jgi:type II secretory pathway component PulM